MKMSFRVTARRGLFVVATLAAGIAGCGSGAPPAESSEAQLQAASAYAAQPPRVDFEIRTLSNRADLISDGDALVQVQVPAAVPMENVRLTLNGHDVTS